MHYLYFKLIHIHTYIYVKSIDSCIWCHRVVSFWTSDPGYIKHSLGFYLTGVAASAGLVGVFSHLRTILGFHLGLRASKRLHSALLQRVLHAPVSFFDTTPVGRIVQRFSKDTDQVK